MKSKVRERVEKSIRRRKSFKSWLWQGIYCIGTAAASAAVMYTLLPVWLALTVAAVVVAHEFGHYFAAKKNGVNVKLPFFIPLGYGILGGTYVKDHQPGPAMEISMTGPFVGGLVAASILIGAFAAGNTPMMWAGFWMLVFQVWSGTFGSDGRRYRRARNEVKTENETLNEAVLDFASN